MGEAREGGGPKKKRWHVRPLLRAVHRDMGYVAVGLTLIYATSGLALDHIAAWDASFVDSATTYELGPGLPSDDVGLERAVLTRLGVRGVPKDVYRSAPDRFDIVLDHRSLHVNPLTGHVLDEGQRPRVFLRIANWLHVNRGKKAWTYVADTYAVGLLLLAISGMFMIAGRKGFFWRGAVLVAIGVAIPTAYVVISGGP